MTVGYRIYGETPKSQKKIKNPDGQSPSHSCRDSWWVFTGKVQGCPVMRSDWLILGSGVECTRWACLSLYMLLLPGQMCRVGEGGKTLPCGQFKVTLISRLCVILKKINSLRFDPIPSCCSLGHSQEAHSGSIILCSCNWTALPVAHFCVASTWDSVGTSQLASYPYTPSFLLNNDLFLPTDPTQGSSGNRGERTSLLVVRQFHGLSQVLWLS